MVNIDADWILKDREREVHPLVSAARVERTIRQSPEVLMIVIVDVKQ
jgi:hypothetical protein